MSERDQQGLTEVLQKSLGSRSGIWTLTPMPRRLFVFWDIEPIWLEAISRHFSTPWQDLPYYVGASAEEGRSLAQRVDAEVRHTYVDLDGDFGQGLAEWGIWGKDGPHLVLLRTAVGLKSGLERHWPEFDGYGESRPFSTPLEPVRGSR